MELFRRIGAGFENTFARANNEVGANRTSSDDTGEGNDAVLEAEPREREISDRCTDESSDRAEGGRYDAAARKAQKETDS